MAITATPISRSEVVNPVSWERASENQGLTTKLKREEGASSNFWSSKTYNSSLN